jgi:polar amino acid transport system substrate-binding protein
MTKKGNGKMQNMDGFGTDVNQTERASTVPARDLGGLSSGVRRNYFRIFLKSVAALATTVLVAAVTAAPVLADSLADIKKAGVVKFGVKADVKPWAYVDSAGKPIGFEIDMAQEIAKGLGVKPHFTTVTSANRIQYLNQGNINIVLATMSDTKKRRKVVKMIEPHYYGDATNILAPAGTKLKKWPDLKNSVLCGVRGAFYNKPIAQEYTAEVKAFKGPPEAIAALKQNQCQAFIFSDQVLRIQQETEPDLKDFLVALEPRDTDLWAIAVNLGEKDASLAKALSDAISALHKSGKMLELAKGHGLGGNPFLRAKANK